MKVLKGYRFRIYPDEQQIEFFKQTFGCVRFTYNQLLMARKSSNHSEESLKLTPASLKAKHPFLKKTDSLALANAQRNLDRAYTNFFQGRASYPKLKSKKSVWQSYTTNNQKHTIYFEADKLKLPKLKSLVSVHQHRELKGHIKSATISAKEGREFYVSILCLEEVSALPKTQKAIGISFSPEQLVEVSRQFALMPKLVEPEFDEKLQREKRKLELRAKVAKKHKVLLKNAKNYQKQKQRVAKLFTEKADKRNDYIDQLTYALVREFDYLFVEKTPTPKSETELFSMTDWYTFIQKLTYKANWYEKKFVPITTDLSDENRSVQLEMIGKELLKIPQ